jgi:hypothetical protein
MHSFVGPGAIKMWRPLSIITDIGYDTHFLFLFLMITKNTSKFLVILEDQICGFYLYFVRVARLPRLNPTMKGNCTFKCWGYVASNDCNYGFVVMRMKSLLSRLPEGKRRTKNDFRISGIWTSWMRCRCDIELKRRGRRALTSICIINICLSLYLIAVHGIFILRLLDK